MSKGSAESETNASPMAALIADMKSAKAATRERMLRGALEKAYSRDVIDAKISETAMSTYDPV